MTNQGNWKKSKKMSLTNRGLETSIGMAYLIETESYRVTKVERMIGGIPSTTYDRILDGTEAVESFRHLCTEAIEQEFTHPKLTSDTKVFDLKDAEGE